MKKVFSILVLVGIMICAGHVNAALYPSQDTQIVQSGINPADGSLWDASTQNFSYSTDLITNWGDRVSGQGIAPV